MARTNRPHPWMMLLPALAILVVVGVVPLLIVFHYSFYDIFTLQSRSWVGTQWYQDLLTSDRFYDSLARSLGFSALALSIQFPLGICIALMIPRSGPVRTGTLVLLALPLVVPWNMIPIIWLSLIDADTGLIGQAITAVGWEFDYKFNAIHTWALIAVMDTWHWVGLVAILSYSGLASISPSHYQAAAIDQASRWQVFRWVELPAMRGVLLMAFLLRFMDSFMIYTEAFGINAGGPAAATSFLTLDLGEEMRGFDYGPASARSIVYFAMTACVVWVFLRGFSREESGR
ncbi:carbohydrate ABC transporter permease [Jannaschia sp. CCS1]|uniref:carbohydrate ABC transporter permease n=1 Tax=Jannaschia sp. (strain CCS1) TaxID=290400 RepID=UPI000053B7F4|nr:sugar ABC transporter permease [Jannaschia sp. CCS1]ABD57023.1 carbohydrate ABC transporter membrane protein 1, CUT1 family [Jannaschia sp. CCS1]